MKKLVVLLFSGVVIILLATSVAFGQTYTEGVAKIINDNCVVCHRDGGIGPMAFENYDQIRPWAPLIKHKVINRDMPPYQLDRDIGLGCLGCIQGDWRLSDEDIAVVANWVDNGAPLGNPDIVVPPADVKSLDDWNFAAELGQPDLIIPSSPYDIPAQGNDLWSKEFVNVPLSQDRCIKAVQVKPRGDASAVVHHANSDIYTYNEYGEPTRYAQLTEYAMGKWGELIPEGVCRKFPANSAILWNLHFYPGGIGAAAQGAVVEDNIVEIGVWFHNEDYSAKYEQDLRLYPVGSRNDLVIPANGHLLLQGFHSFDHPVRIDSYQPHGHLRLVAASLEIFYPETGRTEPISQISNWSAIWHHSHIYQPDIAPLVPTGAVLITKQWYDNTADNPNNPDPDQWVVWGQRTGDSMNHSWIAVTHLDEEGYQELLAAR